MNGLKCARCLGENLPNHPSNLAEYMIRGTSVCERHGREILRDLDSRGLTDLA